MSLFPENNNNDIWQEIFKKSKIPSQKTEKQEKNIPMKYNKATGWVINKDVK